MVMANLFTNSSAFYFCQLARVSGSSIIKSNLIRKCNPSGPVSPPPSLPPVRHTHKYGGLMLHKHGRSTCNTNKITPGQENATPPGLPSCVPPPHPPFPFHQAWQLDIHEGLVLHKHGRSTCIANKITPGPTQLLSA